MRETLLEPLDHAPTTGLVADYDDDDNAPTLAHRSPFQSSIELRAAPTSDSEQECIARFLAVLSSGLEGLDERIDSLVQEPRPRPHDVAARAASTAVDRRIGDVIYVRDALENVRRLGDHARLAPLYEPNAPLAPFIKGLCIWCDGVLEALVLVRSELVTLSPDWQGLRARLEAAGQFYFTGLVVQIRDQTMRLRRTPGIGAGHLEAMISTLDELYFTASLLERGLAERFG